MHEEPGAEQVPSLNTIIPGQPEGCCSLPPDVPLTPSLAKGAPIPPQDSPRWPAAPSADLINIENQLWQQFSG